MAQETSFSIIEPQETESSQSQAFVIEHESADNAQASFTTVDVVQPEPKKRGRRAGTRNLPKITDVTESLGLANLALGNVNALAVAMFGDIAALNNDEKALLYPPIARSIARLSPTAATKASVFVDPIAILLGFGFWMRRIIKLKTEERSRDNRIEAEEFARASGLDWNRVAAKVSSGDSGANPTPGIGATEPDRQNGSTAGSVPPEILNSISSTIDGTE